MEPTIADMQAAANELNDKLQTTFATAKDENRELTATEAENVDTWTEDFDALKTKIEGAKAQQKKDERARRVIAANDWLNKPQPRQVEDDQVGATRVPATVEDKTNGFADFGAFAHAVFRSKFDNIPALHAAPSTYSNEGVGADGGFAVPPAFANEIKDLMLNEESLMARCDVNQVAGNSMDFPVSEQTAWGGTGIQAYWTGEGSQGTEVKPVLQNRTLKLQKLLALVKVTEEMLEDSMLIGGYLTSKVADAFRWETNDAIINGDGAGKPLGILNSPCLVSTTRAASGNDIDAADIGNVFARLLPESHSSAVWVVHQSIYPSLMQMTIGDQPIWTSPANGLREAPSGLLLGRPIIVSQAARATSLLGDLMLCDFSKYLMIQKGGGVRSDWSMHLHFDYDVQTYRAALRVDGQPWLQTAVTPDSGSDTLSHFVAVAA